jgi:murein DD-endopeptidase MepM/ murein hydrolase activator NlpD
MKNTRQSFILILLVLAFISTPVSAQSETVLPTYVVQSGDTLYSIALRFGIDLQVLIDANTQIDPNNLSIGDQINIPGYEGIEGTITSILVQPGQTFRNLAISSQANLDTLSRLSRITSSSELHIGTEIFLIEPDKAKAKISLSTLSSAQSVEEAALGLGVNPWTLRLSSQYEDEKHLISGDILYFPQESALAGQFSSDLPQVIINPLPVIQGKTLTFSVQNAADSTINGEFNSLPLYFHQNTDGRMIAFAGVPALQEPGLIPISIKVFKGDTLVYEMDQSALLESGNYPSEAVTGVDASTVDPETIDKENAILSQLIKNTDVKYWDAPFIYPVDDHCFGSNFGLRRTYNGGVYNYYHTGIDFVICLADNLNIYAAAPGVVIFSEELPIKGLFTIIDHGWGVYTGYAHMSETFVSPGQIVQAGDLIGIIGSTGRSVGPHLHWEVWVNGIPVDPLQWIEQTFPAK